MYVLIRRKAKSFQDNFIEKDEVTLVNLDRVETVTIESSTGLLKDCNCQISFGFNKKALFFQGIKSDSDYDESISDLYEKLSGVDNDKFVKFMIKGKNGVSFKAVFYNKENIDSLTILTSDEDSEDSKIAVKNLIVDFILKRSR